MVLVGLRLLDLKVQQMRRPVTELLWLAVEIETDFDVFDAEGRRCEGYVALKTFHLVCGVVEAE